MEKDAQVMRLALVGCGAVTEMRYLPAASEVPGLSVTCLVDTDGNRAAAVAEAFGVPRAATHYRDMVGDVDGVVVATPPATHAPIAIECLEAGIHVLCEKPMAVSLEDGRAMVEAARGSTALLSVGMVRRLGRSVTLLKRLLDRDFLGRLDRIEAEEGGEFGWPLRTGNLFTSREEGGVLRDTGTHVLDLVLWLVASRSARLTGYADDSLGGVEANARAELELVVDGRALPAQVEVSFTRQLDNAIRVYGEAGWLEARTLGGADVRFHSVNGDPEPIVVGFQGGRARSRVEDFTLQLEAFIDAVRCGGPPPVPPEDALAVIALLDECHRTRRQRLQPWELPPGPAAEPAREGA